MNSQKVVHISVVFFLKNTCQMLSQHLLRTVFLIIFCSGELLSSTFDSTKLLRLI